VRSNSAPPKPRAALASRCRMYDFSMRFVNATNNFSAASYQAGPFIAQLFSLFTQIASPNRPLAAVPLLSIHATHDTTIKPILNFFGQVAQLTIAAARARPLAAARARPLAAARARPLAAARARPLAAATRPRDFRRRTTAARPASLDGRLIVPCSCLSCARTAAEVTS
jgi:hypothetical protein